MEHDNMQDDRTASCESCGRTMVIDTISKWDNRYCTTCQNPINGVMADYETVRRNSVMIIMKLLKNDYTETTYMVDRVLKKLPRWNTGVVDIGKTDASQR